jgi:non-canonical poly(A) RNA polymerase PAPD5/7
MYHFQGNQGNQNTSRRPPRTFDFRYPPPKPSERPLLTARHNSSEALTFPTNHTQDRYREIADLSDADEAEMDMSESGDEQHRPKKLRLEANSGLTSATPRWSNPDPYTSLPPVDDSSRKRKDVVKLIRKARVETAAAPGVVVANDQDFISFDFDADNVDANIYSPPPGAPTGPKSDFPARTMRTKQQAAQPSMPFGKRKRDDSENQLHPTPSQKKQSSGDDMVLPQWQPNNNVNPTPWLQPVNDLGLEAPGVALHKEVIDFYEWVKPRDFEHTVREDVIARLQKAFERLEPGGRLEPFGSFAAGLYLPTGDMDLVFLRSSFRGTRISSTGKLAKPKIETVTTFTKFIRNQGLAQGTVKPILHAKVPIIKFVERVSGLKVDLSFDNDTGVTANETFHKWKVQYPAMPILVSIIKHFLMIRGLNDVAFGGLGGFSIICLVTSLVQHFPSTSQPPNLGLMLLEFFNLYGNLFNRHDIAIRLDPPSYISKVRTQHNRNRTANRISREGMLTWCRAKRDPIASRSSIHIGQITTSLLVHTKSIALSTALLRRTRFCSVGFTTRLPLLEELAAF